MMVHVSKGNPSIGAKGVQANDLLGWVPKTSFSELVKMMVDSDILLAEREKVLLEKGLISKTW